MANLGLSMTDGHSTGGTPGTGLGPSGGSPTTSTSSRRCRRAPSRGRGSAAARAGGRIGRLRRGGDLGFQENETVCGDAWTVRYLADEMTTAIVDGLGTGCMPPKPRAPPWTR
jgi:hypothetical protein